MKKKIINDKLKWDSSNVTINEISRDAKDSKRILLANRLSVEQTMGSVPTIYGQKLVQKLINDYV